MTTCGRSGRRPWRAPRVRQDDVVCCGQGIKTSFRGDGLTQQRRIAEDAWHDPMGRNRGNSRNGTRTKTVLTEIGPVEVEVPRDATFE